LKVKKRGRERVGGVSRMIGHSGLLLDVRSKEGKKRKRDREGRGNGVWLR